MLIFAAVSFTSQGVVFIASDGTGSGDSWNDAASISIIGKAVGGEEYWLKAGEYDFSGNADLTAGVAAQVPIIIRGGFAGTESMADERAGSAKTVFDGKDAVTNVVSLVLPEGGKTVLDRLVITGGNHRGLDVTGKGELDAIDLTITLNGLGTEGVARPGRGVRISGDAVKTIANFIRCDISRNMIRVEENNSFDDYAYGMYAKSLKKIVLEDTRFFNNGIDLDELSGKNRPGRDKNAYGAAYFQDCVIAAKGCSFIGNLATVHGYTAQGAGIYLTANCNGSSFLNCAWVGNANLNWMNNNSGQQNRDGRAAIHINLGAVAQSVNFDNCTVAYNAGVGGRCGGLEVKKGQAIVRNSIIFGNLNSSCANNPGARDVYVSTAEGYIDMDYSLLGSLDLPHIKSEAAGNLTLGKHMVCGNALFATAPAAWVGMFAKPDGSSYIDTSACDRVWYNWSKLDYPAALEKIDVHLQSTKGRWNGTEWVVDEVISPGIDAGDPLFSYDNEPAPNGGRINCGVWGNTAQASKTPDIVPQIADVKVAFNYTKPTVSVTTGGSEKYLANLSLYYSIDSTPLNANDPASYEVHESSTMVSAGSGESYDMIVKQFLPVNVKFHYLVVLENDFGKAAYSGVGLSGDTLPPHYGKGGGANVIHVWSGAVGAGDGTSWVDAVDNLGKAFSLLGEERNQIWIAGDLSSVAYIPLAITSNFTLLGGFTPDCCALDERATGARSVIDLKHQIALLISSSNGPVEIGDLVVSNSVGRCIEFLSASKGEKTIRNCFFVEGVNGNAVNNNSDSFLTITNCVFENTSRPINDNVDGRVVCIDRGGGKIVDCVFSGCGPRSGGGSSGEAFNIRRLCRGFVVSINNATQGVVLERCQILGCGGVSHSDSDGSGGAIFASGTSQVAMNNCALIGNYTFAAGNAREHFGYPAGIHVQLKDGNYVFAITNCTIAFNAGARGCGGAICAYQGTVKVVNSILWNNAILTGDDQGSIGIQKDKYEGTELFAGLQYTNTAARLGCAKIDIDYSLLSGTNGNYAVVRGENAAINFGEHILLNDPQFFDNSPTIEYKGQWKEPVFSAGFDASAFNYHLGSRLGYFDENGVRHSCRKMSPAIDAGDPATPYRDEPSPNGRRINLGAWGGTRFASMLPYGLSVIIR